MVPTKGDNAVQMSQGTLDEADVRVLAEELVLDMIS